MAPKELHRFYPLIFHSVAFVHHLLVSKYSHEVDFSKSSDPRILIMKKYQLRYFTTWNLVIQTIYFGLTTLYDILNLSYQDKQFEKKLSSLKGYIFTSFMFPYTLFVSAMFWSIYNINREWVLPEAADVVIPPWLNHSVHTMIMVFLLIELVFCNHELPSFRRAFVGFTLFSVIYHFIFFFTYFESGNWLYGLFHVLEWHERILFLLMNYALCAVAMRIGLMIQQHKPTAIESFKKIALA